ncbi:sensor histidine kinase [Lentibacillus juripiscarius]|uniref:Signal transduction histidine-protein kinase ArlS n=1 Tax=Lentibacillus juripiscarius TaxID=257446 RepID=A0ABW5V623_9BACI
MKLSVKIILFSSLFMLLLILLVNTSIYYLFQRTSLDSEQDELAAEATKIAKTLKENPNIPESELLEAFLPTEGMIRVIAENGDYLVQVTKKYPYTKLPAAYGTAEQRNVIPMKDEPDFAVVAKPIIWNDGSVVTLGVYKQLTGHTSTMETLFYVLAIASFIMLVPTVAAGVFLSRFITRPVKDLTETMKANSAGGKWEKITIERRPKDELSEMERTFNRMIDHMKENFEKQEMFVSDASHELKTPISIVKSYAQLLKRRGHADQNLLNESAEAINSEADRMQKLVEQMLLLAKNKESTAFESIDIVDLCRSVTETFKGAYDRKIHFSAPAEAIQIGANADQIQQVVYILLDNALKYSEETVTVAVRQDASYVLVNVEDKGGGIPASEQESIFDRFYRLDKSRSRETGGTGLGLSIAAMIAKAHHGTITVTSKPGQGSLFTLKLPL